MVSSRINKGKSLLLRKICGVIAFLISFALATTGNLLADPSQSGSRPGLVVDSPVYDCGETWSGDLIKHAFVLENKGNGNLEIKRVSPG